MAKILWFDTETTGTDPKENSIIHISGIIEIDGNICDSFHFKCHPYNKNINNQALQLLELTEEEIFSYPPPSEAKALLHEVLDKYVNKYNPDDKFIVGGYNVQFDVDFLKEFFLREDDEFLGSYIRWEGFIDPFPIIKFLRMMNHIKIENSKLVTVAKYFKLYHDPHDSISDIEVTRSIARIIFQNLSWTYKGETNEEY